MKKLTYTLMLGASVFMFSCGGEESEEETTEAAPELTEEEQTLLDACDCINEEIAMLEEYNNNEEAVAEDFENMMTDFEASDCGVTLFEKCGTEDMWGKLEAQCEETSRKLELWEIASAKNEGLNVVDSVLVEEVLIEEEAE